MSSKSELDKNSNTNYMSYFLSLKCSGDILNTVHPIGKHPMKEISESIGIVKLIKEIVMKEENKMKYTLYDFCAGNALTSIITTYLLPVKRSFAFDKRIRNRDWNLVRRFEYIFDDIYNFDYNDIDDNSIIISVHPCEDLAEKIIDIYNNSKAKYLILMPCCVGRIDDMPLFLKGKLGKYLYWSYHLMNKCLGKRNIIEDKKIISPRNCIITAVKEQ